MQQKWVTKKINIDLPWGIFARRKDQLELYFFDKSVFQLVCSLRKLRLDLKLPRCLFEQKEFEQYVHIEQIFKKSPKQSETGILWFFSSLGIVLSLTSKFNSPMAMAPRLRNGLKLLPWKSELVKEKGGLFRVTVG